MNRSGKWFALAAALTLVVGFSPAAHAKKKKPRKAKSAQTTAAPAEKEKRPGPSKAENAPPPAVPAEDPQANAPTGGGGW